MIGILACFMDVFVFVLHYGNGRYLISAQKIDKRKKLYYTYNAINAIASIDRGIMTAP